MALYAVSKEVYYTHSASGSKGNKDASQMSVDDRVILGDSGERLCQQRGGFEGEEYIAQSEIIRT